MPERWQRELRRLRTVEMPPAVRERIEAGPSGGPERSRRSRVAAGIVAFAVFIAAGAFAWQALRPRGEDPTPPVGDTSERVVVTIAESGAPDHTPSGTLTIGDTTVEGAFGPFGWCDGTSCLTTDVEIPEFVEYVPVQVGAELVVETSATTVRVTLGDPTYPFENGVRIQLEAGVGLLDAELGQHGLVVDAHWEDGAFTMDAPLYFAIELVEPGVPSPSPTETPSPSPEPVAWWDVEGELPGVGAVCGATSVGGTFSTAEGVLETTAWVYERVPEGGCAGPNESFQSIGLEDASGSVVELWDKLRDCLDAFPCWAFSAPDVDGDGFAEIAVGFEQLELDLVWFGLYGLERCPPGADAECVAPMWLGRFEIAEPGDPFEGFPPGPMLFAWGGSPDASGGAQGVVCRTFEGNPAIVYWFTETYDQWMLVNGGHLRLVFPQGGEHIPESEERLDDFCGAPIFDVPS